MTLSTTNNPNYEPFPLIDSGIEPIGNRVLVQIKSPRRKTKSGIILTDDTRDTEMWNEMTAKVIAVGPLAYRNMTTLEEWPGGAWCKPGDFVRVPKYGGDRIRRNALNSNEEAPALFVVFTDTDIIARITCDPLELN